MTQRPSVPCSATAAFHYFMRKKNAFNHLFYKLQFWGSKRPKSIQYRSSDPFSTLQAVPGLAKISSDV